MGSCPQTDIRPLSDLQEFAVIARPIRRTGPIPFAPFPPLAERQLERPMMAAPRETRDIRETRMRSRWLPANQAGHPAQPVAQQAQQVILQASRAEGAAHPAATKGPSASASGPTQATPIGTPRTPRGGCHATYHGQGTLSVLSSITGHHYRFEGRGCTLTIDPRDRLVLGRLNELSIHTASN